MSAMDLKTNLYGKVNYFKKDGYKRERMCWSTETEVRFFFNISCFVNLILDPGN